MSDQYFFPLFSQTRLDPWATRQIRSIKSEGFVFSDGFFFFGKAVEGFKIKADIPLSSQKPCRPVPKECLSASIK